MNHLPAAQTYREQQAGSLQTGDHLLLPDGQRSAEIHSVHIENDDFGVPALVLATLTGGGMLRIAAGSSVQVADAAGAEPEAAADTADAAAGGKLETADAEASDAVTPLQVVGNQESGAAPPPAPPAVVVPPLPATTPAVIGPSA